MFTRPDYTYQTNLQPVAKAITKNELCPLFHIASNILNNSKVLDVGSGNGLLALVKNKNYDYVILADVIEHMIDLLNFKYKHKTIIYKLLNAIN